MKTLQRRTVVIVGGGLTAGLISRQLTDKGIDVVLLERGVDHSKGAEARLPSQRDELRWDVYQVSHDRGVSEWRIALDHNGTIWSAHVGRARSGPGLLQVSR